MRNLISVAVILHVAFTAAGLQLNGTEVEFGDMIVYEPKCQAGFFTYQHYAIYVGDKYGDDDTTFERVDEKPSCRFSPVNMSRNPLVFNILDGYKDKKGKFYPNSSETDMMKRINETHDHCGRYNVLNNNCEHLATYVRYGEKISMQFNMHGEFRCSWALFSKARDMWKYMSLVHRPPANAGPSNG